LNARTQKRTRTFLLLAASGCLVALFTGASEHVGWLASLCSGFLGGCRETAQFTLLKLPLWLWGVGFYAVLLLTAFRLSVLRFYLVIAAFGVELRLLWLMFAMHALCVYCLANFIILLFLLALSFDKSRIWQMSTVSMLFLLFSVFLLPLPAKYLAAAGEPEHHIVARVGDKTITVEDLEGPLASRIYELRHKIYQLKRQRLDQMVAKLLFQQEADHKGMPLQQLVNQWILAEKVSVTDDEVERYYQENRGKITEWRGSEQTLRERIRAILEQQKSYQLLMAYAAKLRGKYRVEDNLKAPPFPLANVSIAGSPALGPIQAPLTIIEFSDYRCPSCKQHHPVTQQLQEKFSGRIRWIVKDFPLGGNEMSVVAAEAAHCAGDQGKFWQYRDLLFEADDDLSREKLDDYARQLGLNLDVFAQCLETRKYREQIANDIEEGRKVGVDVTPSFIMNGKLIPGGPSYERLQELIEEELQKAG